MFFRAASVWAAFGCTEMSMLSQDLTTLTSIKSCVDELMPFWTGVVSPGRIDSRPLISPEEM